METVEMDKMTEDTRKELLKLHEEWSKKHEEEPDSKYIEYHQDQKIPKCNYFYDGYFDWELYSAAETTRVLFIAKECNIGSGDNIHIYTTEEKFWAKEEVERGNTRNTFLRGMAMLYNAIITGDYENPNKELGPLKNAALINLNKRGGYSYCVWNTLEGYVKHYKGSIIRQIKLLKPNIIVCCGPSVYDLWEKYLAESFGDEVKVKCAFHPSCFTKSDKEKLVKLQNGDGTKEDKEESIVMPTSKCSVGRILDTNNRWKMKYNGPDTETDMLGKKRACAYGNARPQLACVKDGDYILYYSSNPGHKGIIAIAKVEDRGRGECDKEDIGWLKVEPIVPKTFEEIVKSEDSRKALSIKELKEIIGDVYWRGTVKGKKIPKAKVDEIILMLETKYDERKSN